MAHQFKDKKVDTVTVSRTLVLPVVTQDTNSPSVGKFIYNSTTSVPSYADGTEWHDIPSQETIDGLQTQIDDIDATLDDVVDAPVVLSASNSAFPNGNVITAGTGISIINAPGTTTINASNVLTYSSLSARAGTLPDGYTIPANAMGPTIYACAGGGGGGGASTVSDSDGAGGGGSGAALIYRCLPGDVIEYSLGAAGTGGAAGGNGTGGGATIVTVNGVSGLLLAGGYGGEGGGSSSAAGIGGIVATVSGVSYPPGYFNGANGGDGGAIGVGGTAGFPTAFKYDGGDEGHTDGTSGGGGGGGGSIFGVGGDGGSSGNGGTSAAPTAYGAGGGGSSGVGPSAATGGDGADGEVVLIFWS